MSQRQYTYDNNLALKDAGLVAASAAAQVAGAAKVVDLGAGRVEGAVVIDVSAIETATGDEKYELELQLSNDAAFAAGNVVAEVVKLGDSSTTGSSADSGTGRREMPFTNEVAGTIYRYARMYTRIAGTIATGINYTAFIGLFC